MSDLKHCHPNLGSFSLKVKALGIFPHLVKIVSASASLVQIPRSSSFYLSAKIIIFVLSILCMRHSGCSERKPHSGCDVGPTSCHDAIPNLPQGPQRPVNVHLPAPASRCPQILSPRIPTLPSTCLPFYGGIHFHSSILMLHRYI